MRILYLHQYFATRANAGGTRSYEMARRLVKAGHEVTILTSSAFLDDSWAPSSGWHAREIDGIRVEVLRVPYSNKLSFAQRIKAFAEFAAGTGFRARSIKCDVVFATSTPLTIAVPGIVASRYHHVPMVFEVRDLWPELPIAVGALRQPQMIWLARQLEKAAYRNSARVVALSPGMKDGVVKAGYPESRIAVIPNSCDVDLFDVPAERGAAFRRSLPWLGDRPLVVYTGTLGIINRTGYFAELAAAVRQIDEEIRFLIIGDGREEPLVRARAEELGVLGKNFFMMPPVPKNKMPDVLSAATVATSLFGPVPEMWANSANKFFDGLAAGRPVAINYGGWQAEVLERTGAGVVLPPEDLEKAARQLVDLLRSPGRLGQAMAAARNLAEREFARDKLAAELERTLVEASQPRR